MSLLEDLAEALEKNKDIPLKHSLLIASGIENKKKGNKYLEKFDKLREEYHLFIDKKKKFMEKDINKAANISEFLTSPIKYNKNKSSFHKVLDARLSKNPAKGHGNCVGLTSLYNALAQEEGLKTGIYKQRGHVLSRVMIPGKEYAVENTCKRGFNIKLTGLVGKGSNNDLLAEVIISRDFLNPKNRIEALDLAKKISPSTSLIYYNSAVLRYNLQDYNQALEDMDEAIKIDSKDWKKYQFRSKLRKKLNDYQGYKKDKKMYKHLKRKPCPGKRN